jgi:hypothetical protein
MNDDDAILSRRALLIAGALTAIGASRTLAQPQPCLSVVARPDVEFSQAPGRRLTPLDQIPPGLLAHLAPSTIVAFGHGPRRSPWRVVLSLTGQLSAAESDRRGARPLEELPRNWSAAPSHTEMSAIVELADRMWRDPPPSGIPGLEPAYAETIALRDRDQALCVLGDGPLGHTAAPLIARLRALANAARLR